MHRDAHTSVKGFHTCEKHWESWLSSSPPSLLLARGAKRHLGAIDAPITHAMSSSPAPITAGVESWSGTASVEPRRQRREDR
jgi:hypothetical protein